MNLSRIRYLALGMTFVFCWVFIQFSSPKPSAALQSGQPSSGQAPDRVITATGAAETLSPTTLASITGISVGVQGSGADGRAAVKDANDKTDAIREALQKVGVPASRIHIVSLNVSGYASTGPPYRYGASQSLQADIASPEQLFASTQAAFEAGATNVATFNRGGLTVPPDVSILAPAIRQAIENAKAVAGVSAQMNGVSLGPIQTITVQPPLPLASFGVWRVQVAVTFGVR